MSDISGRQTEIIEAAAKLLTTAGVSGLTIKNLAKEMQFSESAIYRHFASKEDILLTLLDYVLQGVGRESMAAMTADLSAVERVRQLFLRQLAFFQQHPYLAVAIFSDGLWEESQRINEKILLIMNSRKFVLEPMMKQAQEQGEVTTQLPAEEIVHMLMGSVRLLVYQWRISHFGFDVQKRGAQLLDNLFKIIAIV